MLKNTCKSLCGVLKNYSTMQAMSGNEAAAYVAYALTEASYLFPITPASPMGEKYDKLGAQNLENSLGVVPTVTLMQSENGAVGGVHGSLTGGVITTTFTSSQGLMLMYPSMMKISEERLPSVFHVATRAVGGAVHSIFGDHQDVMSILPSGYCLLSSCNVQECHDLGIVAHTSSLKSSFPFIHQIDGFRLSHEYASVEALDFEEIKQFVDEEDIERFRQNRMNTTNPSIRGTIVLTDTYFQIKESINQHYDAVPEIVQSKMDEFAKVTGRQYKLFEYYGCEDAEHVAVILGSGSLTVKEAVEQLNSAGKKVGVIVVKLFLPWSTKHFVEALPKTCKKITSLDRVKVHGMREPLYLNILSSLQENDMSSVKVIGGRYGVGGKNFNPDQAYSIFENMDKPNSKDNFVVGIDDDLTFLSLPGRSSEFFEKEQPNLKECMFWGIGGDGTIGANQEALKLIQENTDLYVQGYFAFDMKKSGGLTVSHVRFNDQLINKPYAIEEADYLACHVQNYVNRYDLIKHAKQDGVFVLNSEWDTIEKLEEKLPNFMKKKIAEKNLKFYNINAYEIASKVGLGHLTNVVLQTVFFKLFGSLDVDHALELFEDQIKSKYGKKGEEIVKKNINAIYSTLDHLEEVNYPKEKWLKLDDSDGIKGCVVYPKRGEKWESDPITREVIAESLNDNGDAIPTSKMPGSAYPSGRSAIDSRRIALTVPIWDSDKCIECCKCGIICPQTSIKPFIVNDEDLAQAEKENVKIDYKDLKSKKVDGAKFTIQVTPTYCIECFNCANACPVGALSMEPVDDEKWDLMDDAYNFCRNLDNIEKSKIFPKNSLMFSQVTNPYLTFGYGCRGCGEVPYFKIFTSLFGTRAIVPGAAGCTGVWLGSQMNAIGKDQDGYGPSYNFTLFENNAEFGLGLVQSVQKKRSHFATWVERNFDKISNPEIKEILNNWTQHYKDYDKTFEDEKKIKKILEETDKKDETLKYLYDNIDLVKRSSVWALGGDGWSSDINFGGLIHSLCAGDNLKVLVLDTEVYSNTGGQASKATQIGASAKFIETGKESGKFDLASIIMSLENVYVAQCSLSHPNQYLKALEEAESYEGPAVVICYSPCISHGADLTNTTEQYNKAVETGYWNLFRYNPDLIKEGKNPFTLDVKKIKIDKLEAFLDSNNRFRTLKDSNPEKSKEFRKQLKHNIQKKFDMFMELNNK